MRVVLLTISLVLLTALSLFGASLNGESVQVTYLVEVVTFSEQDSLNVSLDLASVRFESGRTSFFEFGYDPLTMEILAATPFGTLYLQTGEENGKKYDSYRSWLRTIANKPVSVLVTRERVSLISGLKTSEGIELELIPLSASPDEVLTSVKLASASGELAVSSQLTLKRDVPVPVAILRKSGKTDSGYLSVVRSKEQRYAALYITAFTTTELSEENITSLSSIEGLLDEFWPLEGRETVSELNVGFGHAEVPLFELGLDLWAGDFVRVEGAYRGFPARRVELGLGFYPTKWPLKLGGLVHYLLDGRGFVALGFSDEEVLLPGLTLEAGLYPLVFDFAAGKTATPYFHASAEYALSFFNFGVDYSVCALFSELRLSLGIRPVEWLLVSARYRTDLAELHGFSIEASLRFK